MRLGIFDLLSLLGSLVFAIPVGNFGINRLLAGETTMGLALVGVAVAMVLIPYYFMDPRMIAKKLFGGLIPSRFQDEPSTDPDPDRPPEKRQ